jgi:hypothetical protein
MNDIPDGTPIRSFELYRTAVREKSEELLRVFPSGFCRIVSIENATKGSTPGVVTECRVFDAAKHLIDGTAELFTEPEGAVQA